MARVRDRYLGTPADGVKAAFQEKGEKGSGRELCCACEVQEWTDEQPVSFRAFSGYFALGRNSFSATDVCSSVVQPVFSKVEITEGNRHWSNGVEHE